MEVTVLMGSYNGQKYLKETIESILNQTFKDFEYLIIDDASSDSSPDIIRSFAVKDPRIRFVQNQNNLGYVGTQNLGVELATGKLLALIDQDDVALPDRLEKQVQFLREHPSYVLVGSKVLLISPEGEPLNFFPFFQTHEEIDNAHLQGEGGAIPSPSACMRTEAVRKIGGYNPKYPFGADYDLFLRLAEVGKVANLPEVLVKYRQHFKSMCHVKTEEQSHMAEDIRQKTFQRRGLKNFVERKKESTEPLSKADFYRIWAWWALEGGHPSIARKYAFKSFCYNPLQRETWKALYCSLRGF